MRAIVALAVGVALIALAAVVFLAPRPGSQVVSLEPVSATPQQSGSISSPTATSATPPAVKPSVKPAERLTPRPVTPPPPAVDTTTEPGENPPDVDPPSPSAATPEPSATESPSSPKPSSTEPSSTEPSSTEPPAPPPASAPSSLPVRQTTQGWGVQAGAYKTESNATAMRDRLLKAGLAARVDAGSDGIYRVLVGAYTSAGEARAATAGVVAALK